MFVRIINRLEEGFIALLLGLMTIVTFTEVVARYVFSSGFSWSLELTTYLFAWLVLFGISYGVKVGAHIGIDVVVKNFNRNGRRIASMLAIILCIGYCVIMLIGSLEYVSIIYDLGIEAQDIPIPQWVPFIILPVGMALVILRLLQVAWRIVTGQQESLSLADEAREAIEALAQKEDLPEDKR